MRNDATTGQCHDAQKCTDATERQRHSHSLARRFSLRSCRFVASAKCKNAMTQRHARTDTILQPLCVGLRRRDGAMEIEYSGAASLLPLRRKARQRNTVAIHNGPLMAHHRGGATAAQYARAAEARAGARRPSCGGLRCRCGRGLLVARGGRSRQTAHASQGFALLSDGILIELRQQQNDEDIVEEAAEAQKAAPIKNIHHSNSASLARGSQRKCSRGSATG